MSGAGKTVIVVFASVISALALFLALGFGVALVSSPSPPASSAAPTSTANYQGYFESIAPRTTAPLAQQQRDWFYGGGRDKLALLAADMDVVGNDFGDGRVAEGVGACKTLSRDVSAAQAYIPMPDPADEALWASYLDDMQSAARACVSGDFTTSVAKQDSANATMRQLTERVNH